jgi:down-regulator of transcription 1
MEFGRNDDESSVPKATVDKIVSSFLPKGFVVPRESKEIFLHGCIEFLTMVTLEANRACEADKKKTIAHDHVYKALEATGFGPYIEECKTAHLEYESYLKQKPSKIDKFKDSGLSMEELHDQQLKLFQSAKMQFEKSFEDEYEKGEHDAG